MKVISRVKIDSTPDVKKTGVEILSDNGVALEYTTVTGAFYRIEMSRAEFEQQVRDVREFWEVI